MFWAVLSAEHFPGYMSVPQTSKRNKQNKNLTFKKEENIVSAIPSSIIISSGARWKHLSALGFLLVAGADKHKLHESTCIKEAQWAKEN